MAGFKVGHKYTCARNHVDVFVTGGTGPLILNLGTKREVSGQLHAPAALPLGKSPQFTQDKNLDGLQSPTGRFDDDDILLLSGSMKGS